MITITLDWIAFTFLQDTENAAKWIHRFARNTSSVAITARNGYRAAYRTKENVDVFWNVDRPEMGYHVIIAGTAIRNICEHYELDQEALLETVLHAGGSITRLDLAKDLTGEECSLDNIYQALERGEHKGTARTFSQIHSLNGGNTIYVGSRQSEKFIRIYDKAAQVGVPQGLWKRYELETKGMVARALASKLMERRSWGGAFDSIATGMVNLEASTDYQAFFPPGNPIIGIPKLEKKSDREKWIEDQVIPAVVKHYIEHSSSKAIALLRSMLDQVDHMGFDKTDVGT